MATAKSLGAGLGVQIRNAKGATLDVTGAEWADLLAQVKSGALDSLASATTSGASTAAGVPVAPAVRQPLVKPDRAHPTYQGYQQPAAPTNG